jgi:hypothetical protein
MILTATRVRALGSNFELGRQVPITTPQPVDSVATPDLPPGHPTTFESLGGSGDETAGVFV